MHNVQVVEWSIDGLGWRSAVHRIPLLVTTIHSTSQSRLTWLLGKQPGTFTAAPHLISFNQDSDLRLLHSFRLHSFRTLYHLAQSAGRTSDLSPSFSIKSFLNARAMTMLWQWYVLTKLRRNTHSTISWIDTMFLTPPEKCTDSQTRGVVLHVQQILNMDHASMLLLLKSGIRQKRLPPRLP